MYIRLSALFILNPAGLNETRILSLVNGQSHYENDQPTDKTRMGISKGPSQNLSHQTRSCITYLLGPSSSSFHTDIEHRRRTRAERANYLTMVEAPEQAQQQDTYLYEEEYRPWFVWALILAPCLMPPVWYVPGRNVCVPTTLQVNQQPTCLFLPPFRRGKCPLSHPIYLTFSRNNDTGNIMCVLPTKH
jgi:hypothetical protein